MNRLVKLLFLGMLSVSFSVRSMDYVYTGLSWALYIGGTAYGIVTVCNRSEARVKQEITEKMTEKMTKEITKAISSSNKKNLLILGGGMVATAVATVALTKIVDKVSSKEKSEAPPVPLKKKIVISNEEMNAPKKSTKESSENPVKSKKFKPSTVTSAFGKAMGGISKACGKASKKGEKLSKNLDKTGKFLEKIGL